MFIYGCIYMYLHIQRLYIQYDCFICLWLFYAIATEFQYSGDMMYEMRRRKPKPTLLPTQWIFNLPCHTGMV